MKTWGARFFALNRTNEVELIGVPLEHVARALRALGWSKDDEFWAPDLQVSRLVRHEDEIFIIQETYFDPKVTGTHWHVEELREFISGIDPNEILHAGAPARVGDNQAEQVGSSAVNLNPGFQLAADGLVVRSRNEEYCLQRVASDRAARSCLAGVASLLDFVHHRDCTRASLGSLHSRTAPDGWYHSAIVLASRDISIWINGSEDSRWPLDHWFSSIGC